MAETTDKDHDPAVVDQVFGVLAQIGHDQPSGYGIFASPDLHPEASCITALQSPPIARAYAGAASLDGLDDTAAMLSTIQSLSSWRCRVEPVP